MIHSMFLLPIYINTQIRYAKKINTFINVINSETQNELSINQILKAILSNNNNTITP